MAWNDNPEVRALGETAKRNNYSQAVLLGILPDGKFEILTYGRNKKLCNCAKRLGDQVHDKLASGEIEVTE